MNGYDEICVSQTQSSVWARVEGLIRPAEFLLGEEA